MSSQRTWSCCSKPRLRRCRSCRSIEAWACRLLGLFSVEHADSQRLTLLRAFQGQALLKRADFERLTLLRAFQGQALLKLQTQEVWAATDPERKSLLQATEAETMQTHTVQSPHCLALPVRSMVNKMRCRTLQATEAEMLQKMQTQDVQPSPLSRRRLQRYQSEDMQQATSPGPPRGRSTSVGATGSDLETSTVSAAVAAFRQSESAQRYLTSTRPEGGQQSMSRQAFRWWSPPACGWPAAFPYLSRLPAGTGWTSSPARSACTGSGCGRVTGSVTDRHAGLLPWAQGRR